VAVADEQAGEIVFARVERAGQARAGGLTHAAIAEAGVAIADAEGLGAVSMRKVAARLGSGTMTLYRYVATRDELLDLMTDLVVRELVDDGDDPGDWRAVLRGAGRAMRGTLLRHPWAIAVFNGRPPIGPNTLRWIEQALSRLDLPGLTIDQMLDMTATVQSFTVGAVQAELAARESQRVTGLTEEQWRARIGPWILHVIEGGDHPYLKRVIMDAEDFPDPEVQFERRLGYVVEGLGAGLGLS
jgi:AcrR family transcriptional regulator